MTDLLRKHLKNESCELSYCMYNSETSYLSHNGHELGQVPEFRRHVDQHGTFSHQSLQTLRIIEASADRKCNRMFQMTLLFFLLQIMIEQKTLFLETSQSGGHLRWTNSLETFRSRRNDCWCRIKQYICALCGLCWRVCQEFRASSNICFIRATFDSTFRGYACVIINQIIKSIHTSYL